MKQFKHKTLLARASMTLLLALLTTFGAWAETVTFNFEDGQIPSNWTNDATYPWTVVSESQGSGHSGTYCIKSGNSGVDSSSSSIEATFTFVGEGSISFLGGCWGEGSSTAWDKCIFYIDDVQQFAYGALQTWATYTFEVEAGTHTFKWSYTKDSSVNPTGDAFFIDDIVIDLGTASACPKPKGLTVNYTGGTTAEVSWTSDADNWQLAFVDGEGTITSVSTVSENPYTLSGLELGTTYRLAVRSICGSDSESEWTSPVSFTTDLCMPEDKCEITFKLNDSFGDGWNGAYFNIVDKETNSVIATMTADHHGGGSNASTDTKTLSLCDGREIQFVWHSGSYDNECSYVVYDANGDEIFSGSGTMSESVDYTMNCSTCGKPKILTASNVGTTSATLSWNGNNDSYVLQYRPWFQVGEDKQATSTYTQYTYDLSEYSGVGSIAIRHYDVTDLFYLNIDNVELTNANGGVIFSEDFESGIPANWTNYDVDGDGYIWGHSSEVNGVMNTIDNYCAYSASWLSGVGALTPDNWLIINDVEFGGTFSFYAIGQDSNYPAENFAVYISTESSLTEVALEETTYTVENLEPGTPYTWQVKGVCGTNEESNWASSMFKTVDDVLVFATNGYWNEVSNWTDVEGNTATALPTKDNKVRIDADAIVPAGYIAEAGKATINGGSITIEDGGQLKHKAATLKVTMEKDITGYGTGTGNYKFISSPFTGTTELEQNDSWSCVGNILTDHFDVYGFYSADENEWINYLSSGEHAVYTSGNNNGLRYGDGYLYANEENITLNFKGTTAFSVNNSITADVTYDATSEDPFNGWMLIGNPFICNGYITYSGDAIFYKMNAAGNGFEAYENGVVLAPGEGAFIKVSASGTITYSSEVPASVPDGSIATEPLPLLPLHGLATNVDANGEDILFAKEGYATYYNGEYDVVLPAGMKAHVVTDGSTNLTYAGVADGDTDGNVVPKGTAVLLQVEPSTEAQTLPVYLATPSVASYTGTNLLFGSDEDATTTTGGEKYYKLTYSNNNDKFGWYWGAANGAAFTSPAHKAWLALPASSAPFLGLPDWEDTTGIIPVGVDPEDGEWYTLQGIKVGKKPTTAGVYIHNGRKVLIP